ncbi:MauE/DoxX family redox-associated membrane protein [Aquimarina gracilis]|uniref:MauE/DoxX family redox-associated membrane protein n=1 Tax=Aquimarina gracilis TaxID=874422 RepID=A0ABU5ZTK3_9FLAO|nr:MauE/DoxX family redox-associated membrane protein [Aquimarina gracilis]MEB3345387.1 MauE/DoxX family redox-associated membrane protein [Aquimarina gracilis]
MKRIYNIQGMTCDGCRKNVEERLGKYTRVTSVSVNLEKAEAMIAADSEISLDQLQKLLSPKYIISEKGKTVANLFDETISKDPDYNATNKMKQLRPLFIIFGFIIAVSVLLNYRDWNMQNMMLDFMGLFYVVFGFFKILDLNGFPESFRMYDPLAKAVPIYAWIYPFIELSLALLFLMRWYVPIALVLTLLILGITTYGVAKVLLDKKSIKCACLGTMIKLPMTEATLIENMIMIIMAILMLMQIA